MKINSAVVS